MITLKDILELKFTTAQLDLNARDPESLILLHHFIICRDAWDRVQRTQGLLREWSTNGLTFANREINTRNREKKNGREMGWDVDLKQIAPELLQAELFTLHFREDPIHGVTVMADIILPAMQVEAVKAFYEKEV